MNLLHAIAFAALFALSSAAVGQGNPLPPDPLQLKPDWWSYLTPDPEKSDDTLETRVQKTAERLAAIKPEIPPEQQPMLLPLVDAITTNLSRFQALGDEELPVPAPLTPVQESYSLAEVGELIGELRQAGIKQAGEVEELRLLEAAIDARQSELSQRKVEYRQLKQSSPERLRRGLELMQSRLQLELARSEAEWRRAGVKVLDSRLENLQELVRNAAQRLTATAGAIEATGRQKQEALDRAGELRLRLLDAQLSQSGVVARTPAEIAQAKLKAQQVLELEVTATTEEVKAAQAGMAERILRRMEADNKAKARPDREYLNEYTLKLENIERKVPEWRAATARNRDTAMAQLASEDGKSLQSLLEQRASAADATDRALRTLQETLVGAVQFGELLNSLVAAQESSVTRGVQVVGNLAGTSWTELQRYTTATLFEIGGTPVTTLDIFRMLVILVAAFWISRLVRNGLQRISARRQTVSQGAIYTLSRVLHYVILAVGIMIALASIGIDFTKFALFASALGVGIGFGLQTLVSNFVAGLIILFEKSLKIGDFVELESGVTGEVREINMRSTLVTTNDNIDIVVPNSEFVNGRVTNWTMREVYRRVRIPFGVAYGTEKELVKKAALEAADNVKVTLTGHQRREPQLWFVEFGDSSLNFELVAWLVPEAVKSPGAVHAQYLWEIDNKLREYNIEVPFPQRDLHVRSVLGKTDIEDLHPGEKAGK